MAKEEQFYVFVLVILVLDITSSLYLSTESITKNVNETFMVICKDESGQSVTWKGPHGLLTTRTRPQVQQGSFGTAIFFNKTRKEDTGDYTCIVTSSPQVRKVFSLTVEDILPTTSTESEHIKGNPYGSEEYPEYYDPIDEPDTTTTEMVVQISTENSKETEIEKTTEEPEITTKATVAVTTRKKYGTNRNRIAIETTRKAPVPITTKKRRKEKLSFKDAPKNQIALEGHNFTLRCKANLENVQSSWSLNDGRGLDEKRYIPVREGGLLILNVTLDDAKIYKCELLHTKSGAMIARNITLDVQHKPSLPYDVFEEEDEVFAFLDELVNLTCEVKANPPPQFKWEHRNMGKEINVSSHISVLQLNVTDETPGTYKCTAANKWGRLEKYFDVQLGEHPEMPTNVILLNATEDSLEIKVEVPEIPYQINDPVMDPQWVVVEYKPVSAEDWSTVEVDIHEDYITLPNLTKNTKYEIKAATKNIAGLSQYIDNIIFETSPAVSVHTTSPIILFLSVLLISMFRVA